MVAGQDGYNLGVCPSLSQTLPDIWFIEAQYCLG